MNDFGGSWRRASGFGGSQVSVINISSSPAATTTWNPADKSSDTILSNGNLTASCHAPLTFNKAGVRATSSHTTGKWAFECTITLNANGISIGLEQSSANLTIYVGWDSLGWGYSPFNGEVRNNDVVVATYSSCSSGDVVGVTYDGSTNQISWYKNGTLLGSQTMSAAAWFPACATLSDTTFGDDVVTLNCGQSAFVGTYSGFSPWG